MYTYRVLNENEINVSSKGLSAKDVMDRNMPLVEALKQVNLHIQKGTGRKSSWISTSTSLTTVLEHYGIPYELGKKRTPLVVINNNNTTTLGLDIFEPIGNKKIVINLSNNEELKNAMRNLLFYVKKYDRFYAPKDALIKLCPNIKIGDVRRIKSLKYPEQGINVQATSGIKATPGIKYSRMSKEVIVLNNIPSEDIVKVLYPLEMDIIYAITKYHELNNIPFDVDSFINNDLTHRGGIKIPNDINYQIYYMLFVDGVFTCDLAKTIYEINKFDKSIDILEIYSKLKEIKRNIINQCLINIGYNISYIPLIEDYTHIIRMGNVNTPKLDRVKGRLLSLDLDKVGYYCDAKLDDTVRKTFTYVFVYQEDGELYTLSNNEGKEYITDSVFDKLGLSDTSAQKVLSKIQKI